MTLKAILIAMFLALGLTWGAIRAEAAPQNLPASPEWISKLPAAQNARQLFVVAGVGQTTAWISMHTRDKYDRWVELMTTPGFIGRNGLGKEREGDGKTPVGVFHFTKAFGINPDPGSKLPYTQVDENYYWSGDGRKGMKYNQMVDIRQMPNLDTESSEHLTDYNPHYLYCLDMGYNIDCVPGRGSALFLHCFGPEKPFTGGCVAIPVAKMMFVLQNVEPDCVLIIDSLENLGGNFS